MTKKIYQLGIISLGFLFSFCSDKKEEKEDTLQYQVEDKVITLKEKSNLIHKIEVNEAFDAEYNFDFVTAGIVKAIPNQYAEISSPFSGRIIKSFVRPGEEVKENSPLFEISSPDYFSTQRDYLDSKQEFKQAGLNLKRQEDLLQNGVGVRQEFEEAQTHYLMARAAYENTKAAIKIYGVNPEKVQLGQSLIVRSPISGEVLENNIVLGQYISEDGEPIMKVASLSKIWIVGKVKEKDIQHLNKLSKVQIELSAYPDQPIEGTIYHINEIVDEETRSIEVLIEVNNVDRKLKPGMYVNVRFIDKPEQVILVSSKAILQGEDQSFVFVKIGENKFVRRNVGVGGVTGNKSVILSGLVKGDSVVTEGGIYLPQL